MDVRVLGVDIGSVSGRDNAFAWAAVDMPGRCVAEEGRDPEGVVQALVEALPLGGRVALALEAPMGVPVPASDAEDGWRDLGRARHGEGNRTWSAGAGRRSWPPGSRRQRALYPGWRVSFRA